jgi:carboxymethylenebutenolidase
MCFDRDSRPPIPPIAGGASDVRDLTLTSADGTRFAAYAARAAHPTGAGMVVIPDVRGLHPYYCELALRFAEVGVDAVALDFFARTAGLGDRADGFDYMPHVAQTTAATLQADIAAAAAHLRAPAGGQVRALFAVGFCFGGALAFLQAASGLGYAGVIGFYGWPMGLPRWPDKPKPIDSVARYHCPVLGIYGGGSRTSPSPTRAPRTASSTGSRRSSPRTQPTRGGASRLSCARTRGRPDRPSAGAAPHRPPSVTSSHRTWSDVRSSRRGIPRYVARAYHR